MDNLLAQMTSLEAVLVGVVVLSWAAVALSLLSLVKVKRQEAAVQEAMHELKRTVDVGNSGLMGMGRKLVSIERNMQRSKRQAANAAEPKPVATAAAAVENGRYDQATVMLTQGLSAAQVASATGMSQAEVRLLAMLKQGAPSAVHS